MAPEQAESASVGPPADLYALGVVMYEMLVGGPPFRGTPTKVMLAHAAQAVPPLPPSSGIEECVYWLLEKDPALRPQTAAAALASLEAIVQESGQTIARPHSDTPFQQPARPQRLPSENMFPVERSVEVALSTTPSLMPHSHRSAPLTPRVRHSVPRWFVPLAAAAMVVVGVLVGALLPRKNFVINPPTGAQTTFRNDLAPSPPPPAVEAHPPAKVTKPDPAASAGPEPKAEIAAPPSATKDAAAKPNRVRGVGVRKARGKPPKAAVAPTTRAPPPAVVPVEPTRQPDPPASAHSAGVVVSARPGLLNVAATRNGVLERFEVVIDGRRRGETPLRLELAPGEHTIDLRRGGRVVVTKTVHVTTGNVSKAVFDLD